MAEENQKNKKNVYNHLRKNPWIVSTIILGLIVSFVMVNASLSNISKSTAGDKLLDFYVENGATGLSIDSVEEVSGVYQINFEYQSSVVPVYMTKDGEFFGSLSSFPMTGNAVSDDSSSQDIPKSDKPKVELFVMTHCPYGTQAEKGFIPAIKALGDKIDAKIRFVHYFMHEPEKTETPRQVCIREEQSDKYLDYLECFLEDGDAERCISETGIDETTLNDCIANNADAYYEADSELSEAYGVQGSPTLTIAGQIITSGRSPDAYLQTICSAFNEAPEECSLELSTDSPSAGFGYLTGSATDAQC